MGYLAARAGLLRDGYGLEDAVKLRTRAAVAAADAGAPPVRGVDSAESGALRRREDELAAVRVGSRGVVEPGGDAPRPGLHGLPHPGGDGLGLGASRGAEMVLAHDLRADLPVAGQGHIVHRDSRALNAVEEVAEAAPVHVIAELFAHVGAHPLRGQRAALIKAVWLELVPEVQLPALHEILLRKRGG